MPILHRSVWIIASIGITAVSQPFTYGFVKDTYELLTSPALHSSSPVGTAGVEAIEERGRQTRGRVVATRVAAAGGKDD